MGVQKHPEFVIVGGGIGGRALAAVLARAGIAATTLEKSTVHIPAEMFSEELVDRLRAI